MSRVEETTEVAGWAVTYPASCNGRVGDLGFIASMGWGPSDFVHFDADGDPYGAGFPIPKKVQARLRAMRRRNPPPPR